MMNHKKNKLTILTVVHFSVLIKIIIPFALNATNFVPIEDPVIITYLLTDVLLLDKKNPIT